MGVREKNNERWLAYGEKCLLPASAMKITGNHNMANALSALALGQAARLAIVSLLEGLNHFCWIGASLSVGGRKKPDYFGLMILRARISVPVLLQ